MGGNWCIIHYVRFIPSSSITNQSVLRVTDLSTTRSLWIHSAPDQNKVRKSQPMIWSSNDSTYLYFYYDIQRELQHQNSNPFLAYCTRQPAAFCFPRFRARFYKKTSRETNVRLQNNLAKFQYFKPEIMENLQTFFGRRYVDGQVDCFRCIRISLRHGQHSFGPALYRHRATLQS